jgi:hypothetical protein
MIIEKGVGDKGKFSAYRARTPEECLYGSVFLKNRASGAKAQNI